MGREEPVVVREARCVSARVQFGSDWVREVLFEALLVVDREPLVNCGAGPVAAGRVVVRHSERRRQPEWRNVVDAARCVATAEARVHNGGLRV